MIPYATFTYFAILAIYVAIPTLLIRSVRGFSRVWIVVATLFMLVVQYGDLFAPEFVANKLVGAAATFEAYQLSLLAGFAIFQWLIALALLRFQASTKRRWLFVGSLVLAVGPFLVLQMIPYFSAKSAITLVGLSYMTFRGIDVLMCIQDGLITSLPPMQYLTYLVYFPTISSGPIDRYRRFAEDWKRTRSRADFLQDLDGAVQRIFDGFLLKFILASVIHHYWIAKVNPHEFGWSVGNTFSYLYAHGLYIYCDFAGYSCFAIGVSYLLGIHTPENFKWPLLAPNIREFWNRWHISLSSWLRDHVFMRFLLAAMKGRWFKSNATAAYLGILLSFGLMGAWHGIEPRYLLYGLYHAALMIGYETFVRWNKRRKVWGSGPLWRWVGIALTIHLVFVGLLLFPDAPKQRTENSVPANASLE